MPKVRPVPKGYRTRTRGVTPVSLHVYVPKCDAVFRQAAAAGGA